MAPYLGYGDVVELQAQLVHVNLSFATEISDTQEALCAELNRMIDYMAELVGFSIVPTEYIQVSLIPPVVLILQLIEMTAGAAQNIIGVFQNLQLPVDPISVLKKYVPFIDWDEFEENAKKFVTEKAVEVELKSKSDAKLQADVAGIASGQQAF